MPSSGAAVASPAPSSAAVSSDRGLLPLVRASTLGLILYVYAMVGPARDLPPLVFGVQLMFLLLFVSWWVWKAVRREGLPRTPVTMPLLALVGSAALSTLFSVDRRLSVPGLLAIAVLVLLFFFFCDLLLAGWRPETLVEALLVCATLAFAQSLLITTSWYRAWWEIRVPEYPPFLLPFRLFEVVDWPTQLAALTNLALPFVIVRLGRARRLRAKAGYALWLLAADVVLFYTRSRAGWIASAAIVAVVVGWLLLRARPARLSSASGWLRRTWRIQAVTLAYLVLFALLLAANARLSPSAYSTSGGGIETVGGRAAFWGVAWTNFLAHPLAGSGPLTYARAYTDSYPATRHWVSPHAHNLFLNTLTEEGILGLLVLGWVVLAGARAIFVAWRRSSRGAGAGRTGPEALLIGVSAALLGYLVHTQADLPTWQPTNAILIVMLSALAMRASGTLEKGRRSLRRWTPLLLVATVALGLALQRQGEGQTASMAGLSLGLTGNWEEAARALDRAVESDPALGFYHAQRGYAYGVLADSTAGEGAEAALATAIGSYERSLAAGPGHVPDLLNAAWLLDKAGDRKRAEQMLERAVARGADWALPPLLLAERRAAEGREGEANALYQAAFKAEPRAREMAACRSSSACRAATLTIAEKSSMITYVRAEARALLAQGRPQAALEALRGVSLNSADPAPWLDRAEAHVALGQFAQARYATYIAEGMATADTTRLRRIRAALEQAAGRTEKAIAALEAAVRPPVDDLTYSLTVWRFVGLPGTLLPGLDLLQRTADDLAVYRELARLYVEEGRGEEAAWAEGRAAELARLLEDGL